ncbi:MAG TPA: succinate dehydrogenase [Candidatus Binataceae bacterium]|jgi:succinate dehydrogenase cytochrome b subunit|nr:succinate dehydrogenase [Candidatus Binataceae bacterium]
MAEEAVAIGPVSRLTAADQRHWLLRRLHSLSGIIPIGGFLFFHIFENSYVVHGAATWWKESEFTRTLPFEVVIEALMLWIPISYHAIYGLVITVTSAPNVMEYDYERNTQYTLQRITGIIALAFILFHFFTTRGWFYLTGVETNYDRMHAFMMNPLFLSIYIIGTLSCLYHLTNGLFTFCITWGITVGPRAQTLVNRACVALFVAFSVMAVVTLISFRAPA